MVSLEVNDNDFIAVNVLGCCVYLTLLIHYRWIVTAPYRAATRSCELRVGRIGFCRGVSARRETGPVQSATGVMISIFFLKIRGCLCGQKPDKRFGAHLRVMCWLFRI